MRIPSELPPATPRRNPVVASRPSAATAPANHRPEPPASRAASRKARTTASRPPARARTSQSAGAASPERGQDGRRQHGQRLPRRPGGRVELEAAHLAAPDEPGPRVVGRRPGRQQRERGSGDARGADRPVEARRPHRPPAHYDVRPTLSSISRVAASSAPKALSSTSGPWRSLSGGSSLSGSTPGDERILLRLRGEVLLPGAEEVVHELLRHLGTVGRPQDPGARGVDERARVARREVVVRDRRVRLLGEELVEVVVVDEPGVDLAGGDGLERRHVVLEDVRVVCRDRLQPLARALVALLEPHRGDHRLEGGVRGGNAEPPAPLGVGVVPDRVGQLLFGHGVRVVRDHARAPGRPHPVPFRVREALVDLGQGLGGELGEQAFLGDRPERARVLGEEDVGRRVLALLGDRRGELGAVAVADVELDAGVLLELLEEILDEALLAARVDGDVAVLAAAGGRREQDE